MLFEWLMINCEVWMCYLYFPARIVFICGFTNYLFTHLIFFIKVLNDIKIKFEPLWRKRARGFVHCCIYLRFNWTLVIYPFPSFIIIKCILKNNDDYSNFKKKSLSMELD